MRGGAGQGHRTGERYLFAGPEDPFNKSRNRIIEAFMEHVDHV